MTGVVVIGAGVGGLACAALLASQGHHVTMYEQADRVGGKLGSFRSERSTGALDFDTGPSLLTLPHILSDVFTATGGWPKSLQLQELSTIARIRFADGTGFDVRPDLDAFCAELDAWSPGAGAQWRRFSVRAQRIWDATRGPFLERELHGTRSLLAMAAKNPLSLRTIAPGTTLAELAAKYLTDPRLRQFVGRYATYTGSDPRRAPAALAAIPYAEHHFGGWYVRGGLHTIADALADRCRELGVSIQCGSRVEKIRLTEGNVCGVRLADSTEPVAQIVVANADAAAVYENLVPAPVAATERKRLTKAPRSYSGVVLLLGVTGPRAADQAHHTVLFAADPNAEFDQLRDGVVPQDPTVYVCVPDDETVASTIDGLAAHPWFVMVNAPRQDQVDWTDSGDGDRNAYATRILDVMATRGMDIRNRVVFQAVRTPADIEAETLSPGGSIYGSSSDGARSAFLRPQNRSAVPGLYLVGGSAHPGGGIPLVLLSAKIVAGLIGPAGV